MVGQKVRALILYFFALVQELIDRPSYINEQLLEHDAYISCLQLKKVNVAHDAVHNNYLYNHTAYYHVLQQVIAFLVISLSDPRKHLPMLLCVDLFQLYSPSGFAAEICRA